MNDVEILLQAIMKFRIIVKKKSGVDLIAKNFTLTSVGHSILRSKFLKEKTIGICPVEG